MTSGDVRYSKSIQLDDPSKLDCADHNILLVPRKSCVLSQESKWHPNQNLLPVTPLVITAILAGTLVFYPDLQIQGGALDSGTEKVMDIQLKDEERRDYCYEFTGWTHCGTGPSKTRSSTPA